MTALRLSPPPPPPARRRCRRNEGGGQRRQGAALRLIGRWQCCGDRHGAMETRSPALLLAGEAAAVIAALRSNLKFNRYVRGAGSGMQRPGPRSALLGPSTRNNP